MIKIYGYPQTRSRRLTWMMEELEQDYEFVLIDLMKGEGQSPEFLAVNPAGKVPAMADGELVLTESAAIINYLADKWPEKQLAPELGSPARGLFYQWSHFVMAELEQPLWTIGKHKFALPEEHRVEAIMPTASWEFQKALANSEVKVSSNSSPACSFMPLLRASISRMNFTSDLIFVELSAILLVPH